MPGMRAKRRRRFTEHDEQEKTALLAIDFDTPSDKPNGSAVENPTVAHLSVGVDDPIVSPVEPLPKKRRSHAGIKTELERTDKVDKRAEPPRTPDREAKDGPSYASADLKAEEPVVVSQPSDKQTGIKNPNSHKFRYGNYNRYYGKRIPMQDQSGGGDTVADARLTCLKADWFENKRVLDIGCNIGLVTLYIAKHFKPSLITGIDIDPNLIGVARKNVRYYVASTERQGSSSGQGEESACPPFPPSFAGTYGPIEAPTVASVATTPNQLPGNALFKMANYVPTDESELEMVQPEYDVILALSITKWIHLNWGDSGLKLFFRRIFKNLKPGGCLIIEPQSFASYKRRKKLTPEIFENFKSIVFLPDQFQTYLLSEEVGFESCQIIGNPQHRSRGFRRPIFMFTKKVE